MEQTTPPSRRPPNRRIANLTALVAFVVTFGVLALTGFAVAVLDPGGTEGPHPLLAVAVLVGASGLVALAARALMLLALRLTRPNV